MTLGSSSRTWPFCYVLKATSPNYAPNFEEVGGVHVLLWVVRPFFHHILRTVKNSERQDRKYSIMYCNINVKKTAFGNKKHTTD